MWCKMGTLSSIPAQTIFNDKPIKDEHKYKSLSLYVDYSDICEKDFEIKNVKDQDNLLHFVYKKDDIDFKLTVHYSQKEIIKIDLKNIYQWKAKNRSVPREMYYKLKYFCHNEIHKYITVRKDHYFYKGLNYDITNLYRNYSDNQFKYQILQLRSKTKHFVFYWKHICRNWDEEFLKENLWSRQIIIDFLCRFNKLNKLYKTKKWILEETKYFYLKGFNFKIKNESKRKIKIDCCYFIKSNKIGCRNETKEMVKFFNGEECLINYYNQNILAINNKAILSIKNLDLFIGYFSHYVYKNKSDIVKVLNLNIKQVYQFIINKSDHAYLLQTIKIIYKNIDDEQIKYPKHLKKKIKFECQKILINNF